MTSHPLQVKLTTPHLMHMSSASRAKTHGGTTRWHNYLTYLISTTDSENLEGKLPCDQLFCFFAKMTFL